jgi:probable HAF family extracellular repeat protein
VLLACVSAAPAHAAPYVIHNLGTLPTGNDSQAFDLNNGQVVTGVARIQPPFSFEDHAVTYTVGGGLQDLGSIAPGLNSSGAAINNSSVVAGSADTFAGTQAMTWDSTNGFVPLGTMPGHFFSEGHGINSSGTVVGSSNNGVDHAFRYPAGGPMTALLPASPTSIAYDVNDTENIVGVFDQSGVGTAFFWQNSLGTATGLGTLPGFANSEARAVNSIDQVVGTATAGTSAEAFLWQGGTMTALGLLPGLADSRAWDVNNFGAVVGRADNAGSGVGAAAVLWDSSLQIVDLNTLIPAADQAHWTLTDAFAINDQGDIAGVGFFNDGQTSGRRGFLLTPGGATGIVPEPGTWTLMCFGAIAVLLRRRR